MKRKRVAQAMRVTGSRGDPSNLKLKPVTAEIPMNPAIER
jgi:hypothetical protein